MMMAIAVMTATEASIAVYSDKDLVTATRRHLMNDALGTTGVRGASEVAIPRATRRSSIRLSRKEPLERSDLVDSGLLNLVTEEQGAEHETEHKGPHRRHAPRSERQGERSRRPGHRQSGRGTQRSGGSPRPSSMRATTRNAAQTGDRRTSRWQFTQSVPRGKRIRTHCSLESAARREIVADGDSELVGAVFGALGPHFAPRRDEDRDQLAAILTCSTAPVTRLRCYDPPR